MEISTASPGRWLGRWARLTLALGLGWALLPATAQAQCNQLVWQDEFNTAGDLSKWQVYDGDGCAEGNCNFGNAELQVYRPANATVTGGYLNIATRYENSVQNGRTYNYTSAKLLSKQASGALQTFRYGRIEARMKLPSAQGIWPAFWMLADPGNWPYTGEIDIMEAKHKNPKSTSGTIHYDAGGWHFTGRDYVGTVDLSQDFHVYAVEWSPDQIKWFVDGTLFHTASPKTTTGGSWPFNDGNFYIILNTAVGGPGTGFTGYTNPTPSDYPVTTQVDYVRVYKGTYNYAVLGPDQVHQGDQNKTFRLDAITGGTYTWSVPSGATIVSGQGTNAVQVNFSSSAASGNVTASVAVSGCATATYSKSLTVTPALQLDRVYEDYESNRVVTYGTITGTLTQAVANPSTVINTSAKVGKYVRNTAEQYDVLYVKNLGIGNANDFVAGRRKVFVDVYSTAPVGSKVTMQFENSQVTTSTNFPSGRHSAYRAYTTRQNAWETLEFEFEKSLDAGTNIFSIDNVAFLIQPATNSGATFYLDNLLIKKQPEAAVVSTEVLQNYDGTAKLTFNAASTNGAYTAPTANPSATGVNTTANVAKYVRNSTQQYDVLFFDAGAPGTVIQDAGLFKNQTYQLQVDVYTSAPVGTPINITLQNKAAAAGTNSYPAGRNSTYLANTTKQNQWETLTFAFNTAPDAGTANVAIDQLAILFNSGAYTGETYYLDNIRIAKKATPTYSAGTTFENYDAVRNLPLRTANGTYVAAATNPSATGINTSAKVGQYTRNSASQYDALALASTQIKDGSAYVAGQKVFALDVYTSAPAGTVVSWQLESSTSSNPNNYPTGRHSIYQAVVKQSNAWHTLTFSYANSPDAGTPDADVDNVVLLFAPNSTTGTVFYIDNLRSLTASTAPSNVAPTVSLTSPANGATFTAPASISISANAADSDGSISKVEFYQGTTLLGTATTSPYSYTWSNVAVGTYSLTAKATDNAGATTTSGAVSVTVGSAPTATNLALNKPTFTSSTENSGTPGSAAVDGNTTSTRWSSTFADPQWIYVDLGASYNVNRVKLTWEAAYGKDYLVQVSPDATTWTTIKTVTGNSTLTNDHTGLTGTGRYVRMYGTARAVINGASYGYSLYELEVYGTAASGGGTGSTACTGTVANGDYSYEVSTTNGTVNWKFIPLSPIAGSTMALIYVKVGTGGYAGYNMTAAGSNFTFAQAQATGAALSFYFTYRVGATTAERNSSATPHSYTVGTSCAGRTLATAQAATPEARLYPNPASTQLMVPTAGTGTITITDAVGRVVLTQAVAASPTLTTVDVHALRPGLYFLTLRNTSGPVTVQQFVKE
ncbi:galactose-binding domain-containing protein [Hymenobacter pini]|uniref:galactose-binding domain-containing protein n=1 Tax=Hymenobacter pini TaxID=2880879 RepID=UPI001CF2FCFC|nr:family 16 glycosylhydrolase [Hymenobacter pini]MCA8832963.1 family 16 glycosylhydrolase [Hymenobacter pini]